MSERGGSQRERGGGGRCISHLDDGAKKTPPFKTGLQRKDQSDLPGTTERPGFKVTVRAEGFGGGHGEVLTFCAQEQVRVGMSIKATLAISARTRPRRAPADIESFLSFA